MKLRTAFTFQQQHLNSVAQRVTDSGSTRAFVSLVFLALSFGMVTHHVQKQKPSHCLTKCKGPALIVPRAVPIE